MIIKNLLKPPTSSLIQIKQAIQKRTRRKKLNKNMYYTYSFLCKKWIFDTNLKLMAKNHQFCINYAICA